MNVSIDFPARSKVPCEVGASSNEEDRQRLDGPVNAISVRNADHDALHCAAPYDPCYSPPLVSKVPDSCRRNHHPTQPVPALAWESDASSLSSDDDDDRPNRVHFDTHVRQREYGLLIGDHPVCSDALPLTLDWSYVETWSTLLPPTGGGEGCGALDDDDDEEETRYLSNHPKRPMRTQRRNAGGSSSIIIPLRPLTMAERRHRLICVGAYTAEEMDTYLQEYYGGYVTSVLQLFTRCLPSLWSFSRSLQYSSCYNKDC